jgi:hypothetical protein
MVRSIPVTAAARFSIGAYDPHIIAVHFILFLPPAGWCVSDPQYISDENRDLEQQDLVNYCEPSARFEFLPPDATIIFSCLGNKYNTKNLIKLDDFN